MRKPWQHFHTFARRRCKGAAREVGEDGELLRPWKDARDSWARSRRKGVFAKRRAKLLVERPGLTSVEVECLVGTERYPRPCDPGSVRAARARHHAERKRRVERGDWSPPREIPDRRIILEGELPALGSRQQLEEEMMAWDRDRKTNQSQATHGRARQRAVAGAVTVAAAASLQPRKRRRRSAAAPPTKEAAAVAAAVAAFERDAAVTRPAESGTTRNPWRWSLR